MNPFMLPLMMPQPPAPDNQVPARVRVAMLYLEHACQKTEMVFVPNINGMGADSFDGQKLTCEEEQVFATACATLVQYMQGSLPIDAREKKSEKDRGRGTLLRCPACAGNGNIQNRACDLCEGSGNLMVYKTTKGE